MAQDVAVATYDLKEVVSLDGILSGKRAVKLKPSTSFPRGQVLQQTSGVPGQYEPVTAGTGAAECVLSRAAQTDASGNITFSSTSGQSGGQWGETWQSTTAWFYGEFMVADLVGLDTNAVTKLGGKLYKNGTIVKF